MDDAKNDCFFSLCVYFRGDIFQLTESPILAFLVSLSKIFFSPWVIIMAKSAAAMFNGLLSSSYSFSFSPFSCSDRKYTFPDYNSNINSVFPPSCILFPVSFVTFSSFSRASGSMGKMAGRGVRNHNFKFAGERK